MAAIAGNRMLMTITKNTLTDEYCDIKGDFFNLTKLHHLCMVHTHLLLRPYTDYWMVYSPNGVALSNWKTKIKVIEVMEGTDNGIVVLAECAIMDDNYVFRQLYDFAEYTFYEYL